MPRSRSSRSGSRGQRRASAERICVCCNELLPIDKETEQRKATLVNICDNGGTCRKCALALLAGFGQEGDSSSLGLDTVMMQLGLTTPPEPPAHLGYTRTHNAIATRLTKANAKTEREVRRALNAVLREVPGLVHKQEQRRLAQERERMREQKAQQRAYMQQQQHLQLWGSSGGGDWGAARAGAAGYGAGYGAGFGGSMSAWNPAVLPVAPAVAMGSAVPIGCAGYPAAGGGFESKPAGLPYDPVEWAAIREARRAEIAVAEVREAPVD